MLFFSESHDTYASLKMALILGRPVNVNVDLERCTSSSEEPPTQPAGNLEQLQTVFGGFLVDDWFITEEGTSSPQTDL